MSSDERVVAFRPRTIITGALLLVAVAVVLWIVWVSRRVLIWTFVSAFFAVALSPAVDALQRRGLQRRGAAAAVVYLVMIGFIAALGALFVPTLVNQVNELTDAAPGYVRDLTHGRGPLGFLETKYHVVEKVQDAVNGQGGGSAGGGLFAGGASTALSITKGIVTAVVAVITIAFMTFFMILEGPAWVERIYGLVPAESEPRWRNVGRRIAATVSGYVTGNLLISVIAGTATALV